MPPSHFWPSKIVFILATFAFMIYDYMSGNKLEAGIGFVTLILLVFFYAYLKEFADSMFNKVLVSILIILCMVYIVFYFLNNLQTF